MTPSGQTAIGIIGLGNIGQYHANQLRSLGTELPVTIGGGMDIDRTARDRFTESFGVTTYEDATTLYDAVDAVIITTPNRFHEQYAVGALEAGLDVLIEKPIAHTIESAQRVRETAAESDGDCMVGFHNRFSSSVQVLKEYHQAGRFGELTHIDANYIRRRGVPGRGTWFTSEADAGGGALIDIGAHAIDLALYLLDFPTVSEVTGVTRSEFGGRPDYTHLEMWGDHGDGPFDVDDSASAFIRCAQNRTISLDVAWATNRPPTNEFIVTGTEAGARLDLSDGTLTLFESSPAGSPHFADTEITTRDENPHRNEQRYFVEEIRSDSPLTMNTVEEGLSVQRVMDAIYRSSDRAGAVPIEMEPLSTAD
ncbi:Gfo/Idh/MocA family protein [Halocatena halophila]|uniref:Gfo/Idh/MocA family protein n=1 Tax=Halocatena halophila TaxID=2814576 RepID=UPI002ED261FD